MRKVAVPLVVLFALAVGIWVGYGIGVDQEFKRRFAHQGFLLTQYHAGLVDEKDEYAAETTALMLQQADNVERISRRSFDPESLNLPYLLSGETRARFEDMRNQTDEYLKKSGVRSELALTESSPR